MGVVDVNASLSLHAERVVVETGLAGDRARDER